MKIHIKEMRYSITYVVFGLFSVRFMSDHILLHPSIHYPPYLPSQCCTCSKHSAPLLFNLLKCQQLLTWSSFPLPEHHSCSEGPLRVLFHFSLLFLSLQMPGCLQIACIVASHVLLFLTFTAGRTCKHRPRRTITADKNSYDSEDK